MDISNYLNLLDSLSGSALNIWGFLLSVSLGVVGFLGSSKTTSFPAFIVLFLLFVGFSASNHIALKKNISQRAEIISAMYAQASMDEEFKSILASHKKVVESYEVKEVFRNLLFQTTISVLVSLMILVWPIHQKRLTRRSSMDAASGAA